MRDGSGVRCKRMTYVNGNASLAFKTCLANRVGSQVVAGSVGVCSNAHRVAETKALTIGSSALGAGELCESSRCSDTLQRLIIWGRTCAAGLQWAAVETMGLLCITKSSPWASHLALPLVKQFID